jgi:hypothetical protein
VVDRDSIWNLLATVLTDPQQVKNVCANAQRIMKAINNLYLPYSKIPPGTSVGWWLKKLHLIDSTPRGFTSNQFPIEVLKQVGVPYNTFPFNAPGDELPLPGELVGQ